VFAVNARSTVKFESTIVRVDRVDILVISNELV
jgi:hypothetical protein